MRASQDRKRALTIIRGDEIRVADSLQSLTVRVAASAVSSQLLRLLPGRSSLSFSYRPKLRPFTGSSLSIFGTPSDLLISSALRPNSYRSV